MQYTLCARQNVDLDTNDKPKKLGKPFNLTKVVTRQKDSTTCQEIVGQDPIDLVGTPEFPNMTRWTFPLDQNTSATKSLAHCGC